MISRSFQIYFSLIYLIKKKSLQQTRRNNYICFKLMLKNRRLKEQDLHNPQKCNLISYNISHIGEMKVTRESVLRPKLVYIYLNT